MLEEKDRRPVRALAASSLLRRRDPGARFSGRRSLGQFRSPAHPGLRQRCYTKSGRLFSRQSRLNTSSHYPRQAPGGAVMPGFAAAKPGTGQTVRAIIAPASCRHDNCNAHCLIIRGLSNLALYIAPLRPLPAGSPAGPALHNKTLCKLARGNDEPHAANAATTLKRHTARVLSRWQGSGSFAASTPATSRKALRASAGRCNVQLPRPSFYRLSFIVILPTFCVSMLQPPRHLDIGAVCQTVLKNLYKMAQSLPPPPPLRFAPLRGLLEKITKFDYK